MATRGHQQCHRSIDLSQKVSPYLAFFRAIARYLSKVVNFSYSTCIWRLCWGDHIGISTESLQPKNESLDATMLHCLHDDTVCLAALIRL